MTVALLILASFSLMMRQCVAQDVDTQDIAVRIQILEDRGNTPQNRETAARSLGRLTAPSAEVINALKHTINDAQETETVRRAAVNALSLIAAKPGKAQQATIALGNALSMRPPAAIRAEITRAFEMVSESGEPEDRLAATKQAAGFLVAVLNKPDSDLLVRANAARALGKLSPTIQEADPEQRSGTIDALIHTLKITPRNVGDNAAQSLAQLSATAVPQLRSELDRNDGDVSFRWTIAWVLGQIGPEAKDAVPTLATIIKNKSEDSNVRGAAAWAIAKMGPDIRTGTADVLNVLTTLSQTLNDKEDDPNVRSNAAWALGRIGIDNRTDRATVLMLSRALREALADPDHDVRRNAAWAIGQIRPDVQSAVLVLGKALDQDPDPRVQEQAALSLATIGPLGDKTKAVVKDLSHALESANSIVAVAAADALGSMGVDAESEIDGLVRALKATGASDNQTMRSPRRDAAAGALSKIADSILKEGNVDSIDRLTKAAAELKRRGFRQDADHVNEDVYKLGSLKMYNRMKGFLEWIQKYRSPLILISVYLAFWLVLYWRYPLLLFRVNEALRPYAGRRLPKFIGGMPLSYLMFGGFFHYRPRVLDAWVLRCLETARPNFARKITVEQRAVHVDLPVFLNEEGLTALRVDDLKQFFDKKRVCVVISGEGGAGKTSLACQLCRWAMSEENAGCLRRRPMLPVLLEQCDFDSGNTQEDLLLYNIRRELWYLSGEADPPSAELVTKLLEDRRILLVMDGFSEMSQDKKNKILHSTALFSARATVITSRVEEKIPGVELTRIKPMRVEGDHLSSFMEAYLSRRNKKDLFSDIEYFDYLGKLSRMVGEGQVTVLLAKLYAEQMISAKESPSSKLPENIPDLMLEYLNELNRSTWQSHLDDRVVHRVAKIVAWECLRETFRPKAASLNCVLQRLGGETDTVEQRLKYLESNLRVVQTIGAARDRIRFTLDPLAEYLAALQVMEDIGDDEKNWLHLLSAAMSPNSADVEVAKGFLNALRDCCTSKKDVSHVPDSVINELAKRSRSDSANATG